MEKIVEFPRHFISMASLERSYIEKLFQQAAFFKNATYEDTKYLLANKILGVMFFDSSTRTRLTIEVAMQKLGGKVTGFSSIEESRSAGFFQESFLDTIEVVGSLVHAIVFRNKETGSSIKAAEISKVPLINGGDGENEHPTQALSDMWMIHNLLGGLDNIKVGLVGDPNWRSMRSILIGLSKFKIKEIIFLIPPNKFLSEISIAILKKNAISFSLANSIEEVLSEADVIEMVPFNLPSFYKNDVKYSAIDDHFILTEDKLKRVKRIIPILHIGPRGKELSVNIHVESPYIKYIDQVRESVFLRMALLFNLIK